MVVIDSDILSDYLQSLLLLPEDWSVFHKNAAEIIDELVESKEEIIIPTPVIAEILEAIEPHKHGQIVQMLEEFVILAELDTNAAIESARIMQKRQKNLISSPKQRTKIDGLIIAIAVSRHASAIYTRNVKDYQALAPAHIRIQDCPTVGKQIRLNFPSQN
jgi:predicted nucleic acid-binding protein